MVPVKKTSKQKKQTARVASVPPVKKASTKPVLKKTAPAKKPNKVLQQKSSRAKPKPSIISFEPGTDMATAFEEALKGGTSRAEVTGRLRTKWADRRTRNDKPKPVSTILNQVMRKAMANGYTVEQSWRLVPPVQAPVKAVKRPRAS